MMKIYNSSKAFRPTAPTIVALGNFDGVHLGHQVILKNVEGVYTFEPHPTKILFSESAPPLIQTRDQKLQSLEKLKIEWVVLEPFTPDFAQLTPEVFFKKILVEQLRAKKLCVGYDFTFGFHRKGNVSLLSPLCEQHSIQLHVVEAQKRGDLVISSGKIREMVLQGKVDQACLLLGRPFALIGKIISGAQIGRRIGIPTLNLSPENELLPKTGVYITQTRFVEKLETYPSVTNIGDNPTFPGKGFSIETHLLQVPQKVDNGKMEIDFLKYLRDEKSFSSSEKLVQEIKHDIAEAKKYHTL